MPDKPKPEQDEQTGRFVAGNSGNGGRPKGSRNKLGEAFVLALHEDFEEHGPAVIETVRTEKPDQYLKVIASILPKDLNVNVNKFESLTDEQLADRLRELQSAIGPFLASAGGDGDSKRAEETTRH